MNHGWSKSTCSPAAVAALILGAVVLTPACPAPADTIFDNSVHDLSTRFNPGTQEVGDEIILAGKARYLTNFTFEFWGTNTASPGNIAFAGKIEARVRLYLNNGASYHGYPGPGTNLYDSGWFAVSRPTPRSTFVFVAGTQFPAGGLFLPDSDLTWTIQFHGMAASDSLGVDLFSPPGVGNDFTDYWQHDATGWTLRTIGGVSSTDFAARLEASGPTPTPPTLHVAAVRPAVVLSWPLWATNYLLVTSGAWGEKTAWMPLTNGIVNNGAQFVLTNSTTLPSAFYRLQATP